MNERDILISTYFHKITQIKRQVSYTTDWGEDVSDLSVIPTSINCALSKNGLSEIDNYKGIQTLTNTFTLFASDLADVRIEDIITINDSEYEITDIFIYSESHLEARLKRSDRI